MLDYLKNKDIKLQNFIDSTKNFLYNKFGITDKTYSYSNPLGQLILVSKNISRVVMFYIKDASNQTNFRNANRVHSVHGLAQLQGHNSFRGSCSKTSVRMQLKNGFNMSTIKGNYIFIPNNLRITCINNDKQFLLRLSKDHDKIDSSKMRDLEYLAIQGENASIEFSSDGRNLQTYTIPSLPDEMIDDNFFSIEVNGKRYNRYESMRDALFMDRFVMVRTGLTGGVDIIFGKNTSHTIPLRGETIVVNYLKHSGKVGNVYNPVFKFVDQAFDDLGNNIDLTEMFDISSVDGMTSMGSDPEDIELTKIIAPNIVPNAIIHDKKSLTYYIQKTNLFSNVKITKKDSTLYAMLYPRIKDKIVGNNDYFSTDINKFLVHNVEKKRLLEQLLDKQSNSIEIAILNPKLVKFGLNIVLEVFLSSRLREESIISNSRKILSDYMISLKRLNKIPDSDITKILDDMDGVDTVKVDFIVQNPSHIDFMGNILLPEDSIAVMRGGFNDVDGNFVDDDFDKENTLSFVNISVKWV